MNLYASDWAWSSDPALLKNLTRNGWRGVAAGGVVRSTPS